MHTQSSSKRTITKEDWEKRLQAVKVSREDLNKLVMNFFVTEGYLDAAEAFSKESGTEAGTDLEQLTVRHNHACDRMEDGEHLRVWTNQSLRLFPKFPMMISFLFRTAWRYAERSIRAKLRAPSTG